MNSNTNEILKYLKTFMYLMISMYNTKTELIIRQLMFIASLIICMDMYFTIVQENKCCTTNIKHITY